MPRSFLISNKRYRQRTDNSQSVNTTHRDDSPSKSTGEHSRKSDLSIEHETSPEHHLSQPEASYPQNLSKFPSAMLSTRSLIPLDNRFAAKAIESPKEAFLDKPVYYRPLHHIFRQMYTSDFYLQTFTNLGFQKAPYEGVSFDRLNALVDQVFDEINLGEVYHCEECGKGYSTSSNLARHRQIHRDINDKKARKCPHCDKVYVSMPAFSMHVRTHSQGCVCPYCGKRFSRPWLLQGHIRTHTGEKPFKCPKCAKAFADKSNLRAHIQTHSTEKPYTCGRCGKAFALKSYLSKHEESSCMRGLKYHKLHCTFAQG